MKRAPVVRAVCNKPGQHTHNTPHNHRTVNRPALSKSVEVRYYSTSIKSTSIRKNNSPLHNISHNHICNTKTQISKKNSFNTPVQINNNKNYTPLNQLYAIYDVNLTTRRHYSTLFGSNNRALASTDTQAQRKMTSPSSLSSSSSSPSTSTWTLSQQRGIFIRAEETPNPDSLKFIISKNSANDDETSVMGAGKGTREFTSPSSVSPLATQLFKIDGVRNVFLASNFISVSKDSSKNWFELKPQVHSNLMQFFTLGNQPVITEVAAENAEVNENGDTVPMSSLKDVKYDEADEEIVTMITEILETRIRPSVQDDGGDVSFVAYKEGVVFLKMSGSCSGCPSSSVTLKNGIERMLMHWVPDVISVVQVSDDDLEKINLDFFKRTEEAIAAKNKEKELDDEAAGDLKDHDDDEVLKEIEERANHPDTIKEREELAKMGAAMFEEEEREDREYEAEARRQVEQNKKVYEFEQEEEQKKLKFQNMYTQAPSANLYRQHQAK